MDSVDSKWKLFEQTVKQIYELLDKNAVIKLDDKILGKDSEVLRQIDVSIRSKVATHDILLIIECKDHNRKTTITDIEALKEKMNDVNADKAILISKKGFSKSAHKKALRSGIDLCLIHDAESRDWKLDLKIPIIWEECIPRIIINFTASLEKGDKITDKLVYEQLFKEIISSDFNHKWENNLLSSDNRIHNYELSNPPDFIVTENNIKRNIIELTVQYNIERNVFLGYIDDLPSSKGIKNLSKNEINLCFRIDDVINFKTDNFVRFNSVDDIDIPVKGHLHILAKAELYNGPFEPFKYGGINMVKYLGS